MDTGAEPDRILCGASAGRAGFYRELGRTPFTYLKKVII